MQVPVFRPTLQEAQSSWEAYMQKIEPEYDQVGICKVIPPAGWQPTKKVVEKEDIMIKSPVMQELTGSQGLFQAIMQKKGPMPLQAKYKPYATCPERQPPSGLCPEEVERAFWRSSCLSPPIYGADTEASFFDKDCKGWNLSKLDSLLTRGLKKQIPGVNTSYLYFGVWRSFFGWHTEDMDLYSVNYLHYGAPKQWYCIPPAHRAKFEAYVKDTLSDCFRACPSFFRHKELLLSPTRLQTANIPFVKVVQHPGEMIINSPGAYHAGFNCGFNCAEATNFATESWLELGAKADVCECRADSVSIDMREFLPFATPEVQELITQNFYSESESEDDESDRAMSESNSESEDPMFAPTPRRKLNPTTRRPQVKKQAPVKRNLALTPHRPSATPADAPQLAVKRKRMAQDLQDWKPIARNIKPRTSATNSKQQIPSPNPTLPATSPQKQEESETTTLLKMLHRLKPKMYNSSNKDYPAAAKALCPRR